MPVPAAPVLVSSLVDLSTAARIAEVLSDPAAETVSDSAAETPQPPKTRVENSPLKSKPLEFRIAKTGPAKTRPVKGHMFRSPLRLTGVGLVLVAAVALTACSVEGAAAGGETSSRAPGEATPQAAEPQPSASPSPGSVLSVPTQLPPIEAGVEIVFVVAEGTDDAIPDAVEKAAASVDASVDVVVSEPSGVVTDLAAAAERSDVVLVSGADLLVSLDAVSSQTLDVQFLVLGAQLPEPTGNVTAVVWPGADARNAGSPASDDLVERVPTALKAGLALIGDGGAGMVYELP